MPSDTRLGGLASSNSVESGRPASAGEVGVSALLAGVRRQHLASDIFIGHPVGGHPSVARWGRHPLADKRPRSAEDGSLTGSTPPAKKVAKDFTVSTREAGSAKDRTTSADDESTKASARSEKGVTEAIVGRDSVSELEAHNVAVAADMKGAELPSGNVNDGEEDFLPPTIRERMTSVAEQVAAAGARGATSMDAQGAAAAVVSLLHAAVSSSLQCKRGPLTSSQQQPLEALCKRLGLGVLRGKENVGCGDDLVMAVCNGFVTPALSLRNCLAFVKAVLVPRARSLSTPASRLLVTAVSGIGKARPEAVIDGLIRPLLCEGDPLKVGSAQCELCTRLIKQVGVSQGER